MPYPQTVMRPDASTRDDISKLNKDIVASFVLSAEQSSNDPFTVGHSFVIRALLSNCRRRLITAMQMNRTNLKRKKCHI